MKGEKERKGKEVGRFVGKLFSQSLSEEKLVELRGYYIIRWIYKK